MDKKLTNGHSIPVVKKYEVARSKKLGRYITAAKNLSAGELIFREQALAVGPAIYAPGIYCFACMRQLVTSCKKIDRRAFDRCSKCEVAPLCNRACENIDKLHSTSECNFFRDKLYELVKNDEKIIDDLSRILLHLRIWLLKDDHVDNNNVEPNADLWKRITDMEAHLEERRDTSVWHEREMQIVDTFRKLNLQPVNNNEENDDDTIQRICGIVDVNSFEVRSPGNVDAKIPVLRSLFLESSLMAHDCRSNARVSVDENFMIHVHAAVDIAAGDKVTFNYASSLMGTIDRQKHLKNGKYFRCDCKACVDPLEAGSNLSCLRCPRCKIGRVVVQDQQRPYDNKWRCVDCKKTFNGRMIKMTIELAKNAIDALDDDNCDFRAIDDLLAKLGSSFHDDHYLMVALMNKALVVCRREIGYRANPQLKMLERTLEIGKHVLRVLEIVEPGLSRLKGLILYELHLSMTLLANRYYASREINGREFLTRLEDTRDTLRQALTMLLIEPIATPEGQLTRRAIREMKLLGLNIDDAAAVARNEEEENGGVAEGNKAVKIRRRGGFRRR